MSKKFGIVVMVVLVLISIVTFQVLQRDPSREDIERVTSSLVEIGITTNWEADLLEVSDMFTDRCVRELYPEFDRSIVDEQRETLLAERESIFEAFEQGDPSVQYSDAHATLISNDTTLDNKTNKGVTRLTWKQGNLVFYTIMYYGWNGSGKIDSFSYVIDMMFYREGYVG